MENSYGPLSQFSVDRHKYKINYINKTKVKTIIKEKNYDGYSLNEHM